MNRRPTLALPAAVATEGSPSQRLRGLLVDHQLELTGLLDRKVSRLRTLEDLVDKGCRASEQLKETFAVGQ